MAAGASGLSEDDILARLLHPMVNEALIILEENKAQRPSDVDVIWSFGYGWPGDTGGPMFTAIWSGPKNSCHHAKLGG